MKLAICKQRVIGESKEDHPCEYMTNNGRQNVILTVLYTLRHVTEIVYQPNVNTAMLFGIKRIVRDNQLTGNPILN